MNNPPDDSAFWDLLARWEESTRCRQEPDLEEVCRDHPELLQDLKRAIADLRKTAWLDRPLKDSPQTPADALAHPSLADYELLGLLGEGGMGRVYKARHKVMDRVVAVKMLKPHAFHRFEEEARTAARLNHPNIVAAYDAGLSVDGTPFLVMEFVDGPDLGWLVRNRGPLAVEDAVNVLIQAATGLAHAHQQGILHLDVKPGNLLRGPGGVVKVLDLGIARRQKAGSLAPNELLSGTLAYVAPEQTLQPRQADQRSDIYSLGVVAYFLLTGQPLFDFSSVPEVIQAHRDRPVPSLRSRRPEVPAGLDGVIQRMVAKRPADRHQTMAEVVTGLRAYLPDERVRQRRRLLGLVLLGGGMTSALLAWWAWLVPSSDRTPSVARFSGYRPPPNHLEDASLSARLNDLSRWTVHRGDWNQQDAGIVGSGDSLLVFQEPLPGRFLLEFDVTVCSGIRPRVHFTETGLFLGNEGFQQQFGIYVNETGQLQGRPYPYRQGEKFTVQTTLQDGHLSLAVNGRFLHTAPCNAVESTAISIRGGDGFSRGKVVYSHFRLYRAITGD